MCWMAAIPIAMQGAQMMMGNAQGEQAKAATIDQQRRQAIEMVREMNYKDADLRLQERGTLEAASQELTGMSMNKVRNMGTIRAAIGEGNLEGNSMDRVARVTEGDMIRAANGVTENYKRDYASIFAERLGQHSNTIRQIEQMQKSEPRLKGKLETIIDPLGLGVTKLVDVFTVGGAFERKLGRKWAAKAKASDAKSTGQNNTMR
ncbi:internal virion protein B [Enterobacter phage NJ2]|uniref:Internal virion protein gp14 n=1 Tax=Enterobacter phage NJ2 TaxID=3108955 RepID=A0ABZ0ZWY5_9CAUD|nr:internal virion protein B [Enterobacter phage NJ2]